MKSRCLERLSAFSHHHTARVLTARSRAFQRKLLQLPELSKEAASPQLAGVRFSAGGNDRECPKDAASSQPAGVCFNAGCNDRECSKGAASPLPAGVRFNAGGNNRECPKPAAGSKPAGVRLPTGRRELTARGHTLQRRRQRPGRPQRGRELAARRRGLHTGCKDLECTKEAASKQLAGVGFTQAATTWNAPRRPRASSSQAWASHKLQRPGLPQGGREMTWAVLS